MISWAETEKQKKITDAKTIILFITYYKYNYFLYHHANISHYSSCWAKSRELLLSRYSTALFFLLKTLAGHFSEISP